MEPVVLQTMFIVFIVTSIWTAVTGHQRCTEHIHAWAKAHNVRVGTIQRSFRPFGPFMFRSRSQRVYNVEFFDADGRSRQAYVRVGGYFMGAFSNEVHVAWR